MASSNQSPDLPSKAKESDSDKADTYYPALNAKTGSGDGSITSGVKRGHLNGDQRREATKKEDTPKWPRQEQNRFFSDGWISSRFS